VRLSAALREPRRAFALSDAHIAAAQATDAVIAALIESSIRVSPAPRAPNDSDRRLASLVAQLGAECLARARRRP